MSFIHELFDVVREELLDDLVVGCTTVPHPQPQSTCFGLGMIELDLKTTKALAESLLSSFLLFVGLLKDLDEVVLHGNFAHQVLVLLLQATQLIEEVLLSLSTT